MAWLWTPGAGLVTKRLGVALTQRHVVFVELDYWFRPVRVLSVEERERVSVAACDDTPLGLRTSFECLSGERFVIVTRMWKWQMRAIAGSLGAGRRPAGAGLQAP
jgi:hypothetical protein